MTPSLFQRPQTKISRPRKASGEPTERLGLTVPASVKLQLQQAADAEGVSLSYLVSDGALRLARLAYEVREQGLHPIAARVSEDEAAIIEAAAHQRGMTVDNWVVHTLMDAATSAGVR